MGKFAAKCFEGLRQSHSVQCSLKRGWSCLSRWRGTVWRATSLDKCQEGCRSRAIAGDGCEWDGVQTCGVTLDCNGMTLKGSYNGYAGSCVSSNAAASATKGSKPVQGSENSAVLVKSRLLSLKKDASQLGAQQQRLSAMERRDVNEALSPGLSPQQRLDKLDAARRLKERLKADRAQLATLSATKTLLNQGLKLPSSSPEAALKKENWNDQPVVR